MGEKEPEIGHAHSSQSLAVGGVWGGFFDSHDSCEGLSPNDCAIRIGSSMELHVDHMVHWILEA